MTEEKGIHIEHHDKDYYPHAGMGYGGALGVFGVVGFIAFIAVLWGVWAAHNRNSDHHHDQLCRHNDTLRGMDKLGYELGYTRKQLNDMQVMEDKILCKEDKIYDRQCKEYEESLRFGMPYGEHTQKLCTARPQYCGDGRGYRHGGVINGSQLSETSTFAVDHSVI